MKVSVYSDLHIEFAECAIQKPVGDVVVLAGDIGVGLSGVEWALKTFTDVPVLYVPGNHEYYHQDIKLLMEDMRRAVKGSNVAVLDRDEFVLDGVRFLGCTMWTDYGINGEDRREESMRTLGASINDHRAITYGGHKFSPQIAYEIHQESKKWLADKIDEGFTGKTVVITHHAPSERSEHEQFKGGRLSPGFVSNLEDMMSGVDLWIHGHTHLSVDYEIGSTRVISNQKGYPFESGVGFKKDILIRL